MASVLLPAWSERSNLMNLRKVFSVTVLPLVFAVSSAALQAQTKDRKLEVSALYTTINLEAFASREAGGGVRLAYNLTNYLALEAEGNLFEFSIGDHPTDDLLAAEGLIGVKAGWRSRRFGVFAKVRPGAVNFPRLKIHGSFCSLQPICSRAGRSGNRFAVDSGAVLEVYPTERLIVRMDVGDTMIRFHDDRLFRFPTDLIIKDGFHHNLQWSGSIGYRF
jgi:hypothetical protein